MKKWVAKIFFFLAVGLQLSHQLLAHHHQEEIEFATGHHHGEHDDDDHDTGHFPPHQVDHIFSTQTATTTFLKVADQGIKINHDWDITVPITEPLQNKKHPYHYIRPPLPDYYKYFSLRAPPAC